MRSAWPFFLFVVGCSDPIPTQISVPSGLDAPLELHYDEGVDESVLDSLTITRDGIEETGRVEADGTVARFWPDHGWFAAATYQASLDGVEAWTFEAPAKWHLVDESPAGCGSDTWDPQVAATIDGQALVLAIGDRGGCLLQHGASGWSSRAVGTKAVDSLDRGMLHVADDGAGFVVHSIDDKAEVVDVASGAMVPLGIDARARGAMSPSGVGVIGYYFDRFAPGGGFVAIRPVDAGVVGPELVIQRGDIVDVAVASSDAGVRAVAWKQWDEATRSHLYVAIDRGDQVWKVGEVRTGGANQLQDVTVAIAEDGWVYTTWREENGGAAEIWGVAQSAEAAKPAERLDGGALVFARRHVSLQSRWGHTALAWLESAEEHRIGKVGTRVARDGVWAPIEWSSDAVEPYLELSTAIDPAGNFAFTWENGSLVPCGARKQGATWTEYCELPGAGFGAAVASVAVSPRGRAYVSVFTGRSVQIAAFD